MLNIAVWGAVIAYVLQMVSFVLLRRKFPDAERPYRSPVGVPGAVVAGRHRRCRLLRVSSSTPTYRPAIIAIAVVYAVGLSPSRATAGTASCSPPRRSTR